MIAFDARDPPLACSIYRQPVQVAASACGTFGGIVGVYQLHDFDDEKRRALDRWAEHIERLVAGEPPRVVAFGPRW